jgi:opacity protein-like surface antigen
MRKFMWKRLAIAVVFFSATGALFAQTEDVAVSGGWSVFPNPRIGDFTVFDEDFNAFPLEVKASNGVRVGVRLSVNRSHFSHELNYAWQRSKLNLASRGVSIHHFYYNAVVHATPKDAAVRPFVTAGGGFSAFFNPGASSLAGISASENKLGYNYGGGIKFRLTDRFGLRLDVRDHVTGAPFERHVENGGGTLHNVEFSVGFALLDLW